MLLFILVCFDCQWQLDDQKIEVTKKKKRIKALSIRWEILGYSSTIHGGCIRLHISGGDCQRPKSD